MTKRKRPEDKLKVGRPHTYTKELAKKICEEISTSVFGLENICKKNKDFPPPGTIFRWLVEFPEFREMYEKAREEQCNVMADKILEVSWDDEFDDRESENGVSPNAEWISRSRLKVDSLKWLLTKLQPRKYGERIQTEHSGSVKIEDVISGLR